MKLLFHEETWIEKRIRELRMQARKRPPAELPVPQEERDLWNAVRACKGLRPLYPETRREPSDRGQQWVARCEAAGAGYIDASRQLTRGSL